MVGSPSLFGWRNVSPLASAPRGEGDMDLDSVVGRFTTRSCRGELALIFAALLAALGMAIASPARATPNTAKAWGGNGQGQLGNGTTSNSATPVAVKELRGVTAMAAGEQHAL